MAFSQDDLDALHAAIATGAREVEFGSGADRRRVIYRSLEEMRSVAADIAAALSPAARFSPISFAEFSRE